MIIIMIITIMIIIGLEEILERTSGKYCFGDKISQADIFLYP
jgi:glutathione S-transferase